MPSFLFAGAGRQARSCAAFLLEQFDDTRVCFADRDQAQLERAKDAQLQPKRVTLAVADGEVSEQTWGKLLDDCDCVISCLPFFCNENLSALAVRHGVHFCDLGGNKDVVQRQLQLDAAARQAGISVVPDSGLAPGAANVLAEYWHGNWSYQSVSVRCGGLPRVPRNILQYQLTFSAWGLVNEYLEDCEVSRGGRLETVPGLSEPESVEGLPIPGDFEAFMTSGGTSIAARLYAPRGIDYEYKTIRYAGHREIIAAMQELGLFDDSRPARKADGSPVSATMRELAVSALEDSLRSDGDDLVVVQIVVRGTENGKPRQGRIDWLDYADDRHTAMERTTGFPTAILAAAQVGLYDQKIPPGAHAPFQVLDPALLIRELGRGGVRGIKVSDV